MGAVGLLALFVDYYKMQFSNLSITLIFTVMIRTITFLFICLLSPAILIAGTKVTIQEVLQRSLLHSPKLALLNQEEQILQTNNLALSLSSSIEELRFTVVRS